MFNEKTRMTFTSNQINYLIKTIMKLYGFELIWWSRFILDYGLQLTHD
jgi:hypothetical protein